MSTLYGNSILNLVLGGGGIKGIAYAGVFTEAEKRRYKWGNIAGVSAGALAGSYLAAGYTAEELTDIMHKFDFSKIDITNISQRVPAIKKYNEIKEILRYYNRNIMQQVLLHREYQQEINLDLYRANLIKTIITYYKNGYLFDGDYLEEWVYNVLLKRGIKTFGDLRYGIPDSVNPNGYKIRMTAVDANRGKVIVLPDDLIFYGINPDTFEVATAVRMSTCVPFVFKPVELKKIVNNKTKVYNIVDGGMLDKIPYWLIDSTIPYPQTVCFTLDGEEKKSILNTSMDILKDLVSSVHDIGGPEKAQNNIVYTGKIDTSKIGFLDFNLSEEEKLYLYNSGEKTAKEVFNSIIAISSLLNLRFSRALLYRSTEVL
jgi:NTE family protein